MQNLYGRVISVFGTQEQRVLCKIVILIAQDYGGRFRVPMMIINDLLIYELL